jgi:hypothetical protein
MRAEIPHSIKLQPAGSGEWRGRCPCCGYATDSFVLTERRGRPPLVRCFAGCEQADLIAALRRLGLWPDREERDLSRRPRIRLPHAPGAFSAAETERIDRALAIWRRTLPAETSLVETYFQARAIGTGIPDVVRYLPEARHPSGQHAPAMVALVEHVRHGKIGVHRTFLRPDGAGKADFDPARMTLEPCKGGAVRLAPGGPVLAIGEGLESSLSFMEATGLPTWAGLSPGGIRDLILPAEVREVIVAADPDPVGLIAVRAAARRWFGENRRVRIARPPIGLDFNDLAREAAWR